MDALTRRAVAIARECGHVDVSLLRRRLRMRPAGARALLQQMCRDGLITESGRVLTRDEKMSDQRGRVKPRA